MKRTGIKNRKSNRNRGIPSLTRPTIIFLVLLVIGIIGMICVIFYVDDVTSLELTEDTYQYFGSGVSDHKAGTVIADTNMSTIFREGDKEYDIDVSPIYSVSEDRIYLPISYVWRNPFEAEEWRVPEFTSLTMRSDVNVLKCALNTVEYDLSQGFLYDSANTYIFFDAGTITIDDVKYEVSPLSFYSEAAGLIRIYNYETKKFDVMYASVSSVYTSVVGYQINLKRGIFTSVKGEATLLVSSPTVLENIEKRVK